MRVLFSGPPLVAALLATCRIPNVRMDVPTLLPDGSPARAITAEEFHAYDDILVGEAAPRDPEAVETEELIGERVEWPFGPPDLMHEIRLKRRTQGFPSVDGPSLEQLRSRRKAEASQALAETQRILRLAGMRSAAVKRLLRAEPRVARLATATLRERVEYLTAALPRRGSVVSLLSGAPSLVLHTRLNETLPSKLARLEEVLGLESSHIARLTPSLLVLDAASLDARLERLTLALPELELDAPKLRSLMRRAPRLLAWRPESVRANFEALQALLPAEADAADVVRRQPTLLGGDHKSSLAPKLTLLRELCTAEEWGMLVRSGSLARILTASISVLERLRTAPARSDGQPRGVTRILLMTKKQWEEAQAARRS